MPKYAKVNNRVVKEIIEVDASHFDTFVDSSPGTWIEVTTARKNEPLVGSYYDKKNDVFASPKPYDSWTVNSSGVWEPPTAKPSNGKTNYWDEPSKTWKEFIRP